MSSNNLSLLQQAHTFLERPHHQQQQVEPGTTLQVFSTADASVALHDHLLLQEQQQAGAPVDAEDQQVSSRTIVATDDDVSNGFVKDGRRLPYVFEATETGKTM